MPHAEINVPGLILVGRFSGDHHWPVLGDRWGPQHSDTYLPAGTHRGGTDVEAISIALYAGFLLVGFSKSGPHLGLEQLIDGQWQSLDMPGMKGSDRTVSALLIDKEGGLWLGRRVREYITY